MTTNLKALIAQAKAAKNGAIPSTNTASAPPENAGKSGSGMLASIQQKKTNTHTAPVHETVQLPTEAPKNENKEPATVIPIDAAEYVHESQPIEFSAEQVADIKRSIEMIADNLTDKDMVAQTICYIMQSLQQHPTMVDMLAPEDIGMMVRGLRESYGSTIQVKEVKREKKTTKSKKLDEISGLLGDMDFNV
jgi:hypothetical protein